MTFHGPEWHYFFQENEGLENETLSLQMYQEWCAREHLQIWSRAKWLFPLINMEEMAISWNCSSVKIQSFLTNVFKALKFDLGLPTSGCIVASVNGIIRQCEYPQQSAEKSMELDSDGSTENQQLCSGPKMLLSKSQLLLQLFVLSFNYFVLSFVLYTSLWSSSYSNECNKTILVSKSVWEEKQASVSKTRSRILFVNTGKCESCQALGSEWVQPASDSSQWHTAIPPKERYVQSLDHQRGD